MKFLPLALAQIGANAGRKIALGSVSSLLSKVLILGGIALALAGCETAAPIVQTRIVAIPSAAPYRFITYSLADSEQTRAEIRRHNRAHQAVIDAEKAKVKE